MEVLVIGGHNQIDCGCCGCSRTTAAAAVA
jgi:hypothetical protein